MLGTKQRVMSLILALLMLMSTLFMGVTSVFAAESPLKSLVDKAKGGSVSDEDLGISINVVDNTYKKSNGGYTTYKKLTKKSIDEPIIITEFNLLTEGSKRQFLEDYFTVANGFAASNEKKGAGANVPTSQTVTELYEIVSDRCGMAGTLLASIMENTKPDYSTANRLYEPFSGIVGTILGLISIIIMALLGVTMGLDIAYITIPAFQLALGGDNEGSGSGDSGKKGMSKIISQEAHKAIEAASGGDKGNGGDYKGAVGIYFKYRWKGLVLLGLCLLYLVQGQIYSFVGWFIDLFSGFLGF